MVQAALLESGAETTSDSSPAHIATLWAGVFFWGGGFGRTLVGRQACPGGPIARKPIPRRAAIGPVQKIDLRQYANIPAASVPRQMPFRNESAGRESTLYFRLCTPRTGSPMCWRPQPFPGWGRSRVVADPLLIFRGIKREVSSREHAANL
jgi:hypothetical protein